MKLNIVLVEPEIPQNTGNIARTCAAIGAKLHLVYPLGFSISEKAVKRAGLDYWDKLEIEEHISFNDFLNKYKPEENNMYFVTTKGKHVYSEPKYESMDEVYLLFGKETKGLPEDLLQKYILAETVSVGGIFIFVGVILLLILIIVGVVFMEQAQRKIPIQYANRPAGSAFRGRNDSNIPIKLNSASVIPVIFASTLMSLPVTVVQVTSLDTT